MSNRDAALPPALAMRKLFGDMQSDIDQLQRRTAPLPVAPIVQPTATLPASPTVGQEFSYEPTPGVRWSFAYTGLPATPWVSTGSSPWVQQEELQYGPLTNTVLGAVGLLPVVGAPFAGTYRIDMRLSGALVATTGDVIITDVLLGGVAVGTNLSTMLVNPAPTSLFGVQGSSWFQTAIAKGVSVGLQHRAVTASGYYVRGRTYSVTPVWVTA